MIDLINKAGRCHFFRKLLAEANYRAQRALLADGYIKTRVPDAD